MDIHSSIPDSRVDGVLDPADEFHLHHELGRGNSGRVFLAERRTDNELVAIKCIQKRQAIDNNEVSLVHRELSNFVTVNQTKHPFLLPLLSTFQTATDICFVMPLMPGGDLLVLLQQGPFSATQIQLYAAEICLALKCLHENGIVHRHVRLDNILLDSDGHIKLADYGISKRNMRFGSRTRTFCGDIAHTPPEVLLDRGYGREVDWWAFGVTLYEMLVRRNPFAAKDADEIMDKIIECRPKYPAHMPPDTVALLKGLLQAEPERRFGSTEKDAGEIMSLPYFRRFMWDRLLRKEIEPTFVPNLTRSQLLNNT